MKKQPKDITQEDLVKISSGKIFVNIREKYSEDEDYKYDALEINGDDHTVNDCGGYNPTVLKYMLVELIDFTEKGFKNRSYQRNHEYIRTVGNTQYYLYTKVWEKCINHKISVLFSDFGYLLEIKHEWTDTRYKLFGGGNKNRVTKFKYSYIENV